MEGPLLRLLILSRSISKHGRHRQFLFLIGRKLTDDRRRTPSDGKSSHCLWQGELKKHSDSAKKFSETDIVKMLKSPHLNYLVKGHHLYR
jgi:hypothetical protein